MPLKLTLEQADIARALRQAAFEAGVFSSEDFEQQPLAHGFLDCMAMILEAAGRKIPPDELGKYFTLAFNYYHWLIKEEKRPKFPVNYDGSGEENPPF